MIFQRLAVGALAAGLLCGPAFAVEAQKAAGQEADTTVAAEPAAKEIRKDARKKKARKPEAREAGTNALDGLIAQHAKANGVPEDLVHRVIRRESRYNPRAVGRGGTMGLMQIKHGTARALGYSGDPTGLLSADTNLAYGVRYLAGAYKVANGDPDRAVAFFARGYYYDAKRKGLLAALPGRKVMPAEAEAPAKVADVRETASTTVSLFEPMPAPYFADPK
jgi:soluble lytic murein transglycosylase-like protein